MVARAKGRERVKKRGRESVEYARKKERVEFKESSQKERKKRGEKPFLLDGLYYNVACK